MKVFPALLAALAITVALTAPANAQGKAAPAAPETVAVKATPVPVFMRSEPERVRFGSLEYLGGLALNADHKRFGGISGIRMLGADGEFLAINDRAHWLRGRLVLDGTRPAGVEKLTIAPMLDASGGALGAGPAYDTEAIALGEGGDVFIGVERAHRILRFDFGKRGFQSTPRNVDMPRGIRDLPSNRGIEGLVFVPRDRPLGGALLAFSEAGLDRDGNLRAFIVGGPAPGEFSVRRRDDYSITDAALIPGGDVLILERYFSWVGGIGMRIRLLRLADIKPGALVDGEVLIEAGNANEIDNMEGLAVERSADGETTITVVSDNNFSDWLQRTLLLRFRLLAKD